MVDGVMRKPDAALCRGKKSVSRRPAAGGRCARGTGLSARWRWRFSLSPPGLSASGDPAPPFPDCSSLAARIGRCSDLASATALCNPMILDIARLLLFPALMAFAAASDLFTMTISNRVSLALAAGFLALALLSGMGLYDILVACRRGRRRARGGLCLLCDGLGRRRGCQGSGRSRALVRLWPSR